MLARLRAEIRREQVALLDPGSGAIRAPGRLADLVAYYGLIESVRGWPVGASTWLRFALYLGIPLGSWLGGALVERLLGAVLD